MPPKQKKYALELAHIEQFLDAGEFNEVLQGVKTLETREDLPLMDRLICRHFCFELILFV